MTSVWKKNYCDINDNINCDFFINCNITANNDVCYNTMKCIFDFQ